MPATTRRSGLGIRRRMETLARRLDPLAADLLRRRLPWRLVAATSGACVIAEKLAAAPSARALAK